MDSSYELTDYGVRYSSNYSTSVDEASIMAALSTMIVVSIVCFITAYVIGALLLGQVFKKAGVSSSKAWIPVYNNWRMLEIGGQKGFWAILGIVPIVQIVSYVFIIIAIHNINLKLRYDTGMTIVAVLLAPVWMIIVAFSKNTWDDTLGAPRLDTPDVQPYAATPHQQPQPPTSPQA